MYLTNKQIEATIVDYILDKRYQQAVLLDGDWGSGKTFFVQETLIPRISEALQKNKDQRSIYYVSLYGLDSTSQIIDAIYNEMVRSFITSKSSESVADTLLKCSSIVAKVISAAMKTQNLETADLPKIQDFRKIEDAIIVFDDLERCAIDINRLFGFLNSLVEHNGIKLILIANQIEMGKVSLSENLPGKYCVTLDASLRLTENDAKEGSAKKLTIDELKRYTEQVFSEDILYDKIKEKLIRITIKYQANLDTILPEIINSYMVNSATKEYVSKNVELILASFKEAGHNNLRTLIYFLIAFEKINLIIDTVECEHKDRIAEQRDLVFRYCLCSAIRQKSGKKRFSWEEGGMTYGRASGSIYWGNLWSSDSIYGYQFIDDYLYYGVLNREIVISVIIKNCLEQQELLLKQAEQAALSFNKLACWWYLEDEEIKEVLPVLRTELSEMRYSPNEFKDIIVRLMQMEHFGFSNIKYEQYVDNMVKYLEVHPVDDDYEGFRMFSEDIDFRERYNQIVQPLLQFQKKSKNMKREIINSFYSKVESWGDEFSAYCQTNHDAFITGYYFLSALDVSAAFDAIKTSSVKNLHGFYDGISSVYSFGNLKDFFTGDIPNIKQLIQLLGDDALSEGKITKTLILDKIRNKLAESLNLME